MTYDILLHLKTFSYDKVLFEKEKEAHEFLRHSSIWLHAKHSLVKYTHQQIIKASQVDFINSAWPPNFTSPSKHTPLMVPVNPSCQLFQPHWHREPIP